MSPESVPRGPEVQLTSKKPKRPCHVCGSRALFLHEFYTRRGLSVWCLYLTRPWLVLLRCGGCWASFWRRGFLLGGGRYEVHQQEH